ncbi:PilN domain-containing protein [Oceanobacillus manasiensis]|uniref:PilN domain-containing protein n=1 Tax=Oceanobacillus manasiensis TaxID=586413 RepID=UPI0005A71FE4|nr:hypothetical protein [Oceanobacillus manasiensis]
MSTEINFIKKQPNKKLFFIISGGAFLILACCIMAFLLVQKNSIDKEISAAETQLTELEITIAEQQNDAAGTREMEQLIVETQRIRSEASPTIPLFHAVTDLLVSSEQLISYANDSITSFVVTASYPSMEEVADFVAEASDLAYVTEVQLTSVVAVEEDYEAVLTVQLHEEMLKEELGTHDEIIE